MYTLWWPIISNQIQLRNRILRMHTIRSRLFLWDLYIVRFSFRQQLVEYCGAIVFTLFKPLSLIFLFHSHSLLSHNNWRHTFRPNLTEPHDITDFAHFPMLHCSLSFCCCILHTHHKLPVLFPIWQDFMELKRRDNTIEFITLNFIAIVNVCDRQ